MAPKICSISNILLLYSNLLLYISPFTTGDFALCHDREALISGKLGQLHTYIEEPKIDVYSYSNNAVLSLNRHNISGDYCVRIEWNGTASPNMPLRDCFYFDDNVAWFGGYETYKQFWPINNDSRNMTPFLPRDFVSDNASPDWFGPILHPVWYNSKGVVLFVDEEVPLHVSINNPNLSQKQICLQSMPYSLSCLPQSSSPTVLKYTICGFENISRAAQFFLTESNIISYPQTTPDTEIFLNPIWSTWAAFKTNISAQKIIDFAYNITQLYSYTISQLEIDDKYSLEYGDLSFDPEKFPSDSAYSLNETLYGLGVPGISAWVTPFVNPTATGFTDMANCGRLLPGANDIDGNSVSLVKWWNGYGGVINYVNHTTQMWQSKRLTNFTQTYQLSGLKFDAGGESYLPHCVYVADLVHPAQFSKAYVEFVGSQSYASRSEVRVGYFNQKQPVFFRILDFKSTWGLDHGLRSVVTTVLALGLAGYPFIMPDMIGGNGYNGEPDSLLYVRWLQLNTFLPVMQFSYGPWRYNNATITKHARDMMLLHQQITRNYTIPLLKNSSYPIIRPLWWIAPTDANAININDQFLVGNTLLVAPMLTNSSHRTVYFPSGKWKCLASLCANNPPYNGSNNYNFSVGLTDVLYFKSCTNSNC